MQAVGVSNFNTTHLQEIADAGLEMPSVNQCEFNPTHGLASIYTPAGGLHRMHPHGLIGWWVFTESFAEHAFLQYAKGCTPGSSAETCGELIDFCKAHKIHYQGWVAV
jgi:diketogulonate reductase-like aldo/keto reductase